MVCLNKINRYMFRQWKMWLNLWFKEIEGQISIHCFPLGKMTLDFVKFYDFELSTLWTVIQFCFTNYVVVNIFFMFLFLQCTTFLMFLVYISNLLPILFDWLYSLSFILETTLFSAFFPQIRLPTRYLRLFAVRLRGLLWLRAERLPLGSRCFSLGGDNKYVIQTLKQQLLVRSLLKYISNYLHIHWKKKLALVLISLIYTKVLAAFILWYLNKNAVKCISCNDILSFIPEKGLLTEMLY